MDFYELILLPLQSLCCNIYLFLGESLECWWGRFSWYLFKMDRPIETIGGGREGGRVRERERENQNLRGKLPSLHCRAAGTVLVLHWSVRDPGEEEKKKKRSKTLSASSQFHSRVFSLQGLDAFKISAWEMSHLNFFFLSTLLKDVSSSPPQFSKYF